MSNRPFAAYWWRRANDLIGRIFPSEYSTETNEIFDEKRRKLATALQRAYDLGFSDAQEHFCRSGR